MGSINKDFKYFKFKNFLTNEERNMLEGFCKLRHLSNNFSFDIQPNCATQDTAFYGDLIMESLLINKKNLMQKITGFELYPTYSYWRMYTQFADLKKHKDRQSCEISVTVNIGGSGENWPIFMDDKPIYLNPGDACIYKGIEVLHHRERFIGDWQAQCFLHYVNKEGPYKEYKKDQRENHYSNKPIK